MSPTSRTTALDDLRLAMEPTPAAGERDSSDGTWRPRSTSLTDELPALLGEMQRRGVPVTRVSYPLGEWDEVARKVHLAGRLVRLGGFRTMPAHTVRLTSTVDHALVLTVVPVVDSPTAAPASG